MDELLVSTGDKNWISIITFADRHVRCFLDWKVDKERTQQAIQDMVDNAI